MDYFLRLLDYIERSINDNDGLTDFGEYIKTEEGKKETRITTAFLFCNSLKILFGANHFL